MTTTPIEQLASLRVGMVEFISPDRIEVQLDIESPDSVALNTGTPRNFPRINGYVMIPVDLGFVVGQVSWKPSNVLHTQNEADSKTLV